MKKNVVMEAALGTINFDLVIKNVNYVNIFTKEIYTADIGICNGRIAHITQPGEEALHCDHMYDGKNKFAIPGLIDTHVHIESSMMTPGNMAKAILPHGTTTIACDPHEIANVLGIDGVKYILEASKDIPLKVYVLAPSCLPSVPGVETSGAIFTEKEIDEIMHFDRVIGLGEVMDFPGVITQAPRMMNIIETAKKYNGFLQGHSPSLTGRKLSAYQISGVNSCHETSFTKEALYKLRSGMTLECRESSIVQDIKALAPALKQCGYPPNTSICTDDREPDDLLKEGHIDHVVRRCIQEGIPPIEAIKMATYNAAQLTKLYDHGSLIPGNVADILLLDSLDEFKVSEVFANGKLVAKDGQLFDDFEIPLLSIETKNTVLLQHCPEEDDFYIPVPNNADHCKVNIIQFNKEVPIITDLTSMNLPVIDHKIEINDHDDLAILAVFERHGINGNHSVCLVKNTGITDGAIASTVSHDSHNLVVIGRNISDMQKAAQTLCEAGGGITCVKDNKIEALLELPVGGLMSREPVEKMALKTAFLKKSIKELGLVGPCPIIQVASFALPVVPNFRLTDCGLVDVNTQTLIPIIESC